MNEHASPTDKEPVGPTAQRGGTRGNKAARTRSRASAPTGAARTNRRLESLQTDDSTSAATCRTSGRRARGPTGGAQLLDRRPRRIADGGHDPGARGAHPTGLVAPLEEVCLQPEAGSAICVQRFDDSLNSAIRTTYRISLRSSSLLMPRYPSTRVV